MIDFDRLFRSSIRDVKNSIFTHTFSYTQVSDACKSLKANGYRELQSSHNPLVRRCESKRAQSCKSMRCEVTRYSVNHRIDRDAVEFDAVGVNVVI